ncbi:MAG: molybdenum cofactor biosynthesis protein MoaE, partial [Dehalococcoidia bacterium]|nr:molybdenum cofactor biosynthesis protein MoaE [Dehalococcoidia bacterium]
MIPALEGRARISRDPIRAADLLETVATDAHGGVVTFEGIVRRHSRGKIVQRLEYDVYPPMAEKQMAAILAEAKERWPETETAITHRVGVLEVGDVAVAVVAVSAHRAEAFEACRYVIDQVKARVPIWKKEVADTGD